MQATNNECEPKKEIEAVFEKGFKISMRFFLCKKKAKNATETIGYEIGAPAIFQDSSEIGIKGV